MRAQTAAECYRASKGDINQTASVLGAEKPIDSELYLCYNSQNEVTAIDKAEIIVKILPDEETEYFSSAFITVYSAKDKSEIYELHASALKKGAE